MSDNGQAYKRGAPILGKPTELGSNVLVQGKFITKLQNAARVVQ
jgi:hypothetical protein